MHKVITWGKTVVHMVNGVGKNSASLKIDTFTSQGGERLGRPSFSTPPNKQRLYVYSWQGKVDAFTCQGGKIMDQPSFSPPRYPSFCTRLILTLVRVGKEWAGPVPTPPNKQRLYMYVYSWQGKVDAFTCQGGKITDQPSFSPPRYPSFCTRLILTLVRVGKKWAGPVFPHPPNKQRLYMYVYSWQSKVDAFTCQGGKITDQPSFSPPR